MIGDTEVGRNEVLVDTVELQSCDETVTFGGAYICSTSSYRSYREACTVGSDFLC